MTRFSNIFDRVINFLALLAAILIFLIMIAINVEVITLYFWNYSTLWLFEVISLSLIFITFMGAAWLLRREGHVKMDLVLNQFSPKNQALINTITSIIGTIICLGLMGYGIKVDLYLFASSFKDVTFSNLKPPLAPLFTIIPLGSLLLSIQFMRRAHGYYRSWKSLHNE